ncbi:hypothetical protein I6I10_06960 [Corynebacterium glucuronolyticum]|uniref:Terminase small subunit actinomycetes phage-type domain-containing protein n=1 Tax=Corynebacterium glucuronolyticum TaxID=39791 RepID=A0A7T4JW51_9CORY|nr:hypothetical protein [Corynebacterium glucuronolyticum]QQB45349.1 hypothetical protein I6I10_07330 [Corynebacterium glucuronolyticum]QQB47598.1 hypothetical protein I6I10_06960 [Corynebacterium glucuronolyticum]WKD64035.1 hypothetical protein CGLUCO_08950 [Corynebacterium glucuronolyticum DSM 44120]SMB81487.1 hypothetical protein SAMN05660745_02427 [Corynebacterium glucuronolyticum]
MGKMLDSVDGAVAAATHLTADDQASIEVARELATYIDEANASGDQARIDKTTFGAYPTLNKVLTGLGLNPEGKQKLGLLVLDEEVEPF